MTHDEQQYASKSYGGLNRAQRRAERKALNRQPPAPRRVINTKAIHRLLTATETADPAFIADIDQKAQECLRRLTSGRAGDDEIQSLADMISVCAALRARTTGFKEAELDQALVGAQLSIDFIRERKQATGRYGSKATEFEALQHFLGFHDAILRLCTVNEIEDAVTMVNIKNGLKK